MSSEVKKLEAQISKLEEQIELGKAIERLQENRDFKTVIAQAFMKDESLRYLETSADTNISDKERAGALAIAQVGSHLKRYIAASLQLAKVAEDGIQEYKDHLIAVASEE